MVEGIDLGVIPARGFLQLGALHDGTRSKRLAVYADDTRVETLVLHGDEGRWFDFRVELAEYAGKRARLWLGDVAPILLGPVALRAAQASPPPNVLIFLIDTLRQDHLGCYGYERDTSPHIDAFARDAVRFTGLTPPSSWTRPSVATLLHGVQPNGHGVHDGVDVVREGLPSLALHLAAAGYDTEAFVTNPNVMPEWNLCADFDRFHDVFSTQWLVSEHDALAIEEAGAAMDRLQGVPWFVYLHTMAPHGPYTPPSPFDARFTSAAAGAAPLEILGKTYAGRQGVIDLYDGEIAYIDHLFGQLMDRLKADGRYDGTLIVLVSDHGEEFTEHGGWDHGHSLYEELLRVPLLVKLPGNAHAGAVRDGILEMADIAPTLLDLLGLPAEPRFDGVSARPMLESGAAHPDMAYASLSLYSASMRAAKSAHVKIIEDDAAEESHWFDLQADPKEQRPLDSMPADGAAVRTFFQERNVADATGLQILVTDAPEEARSIEIVLGGVGTQAFQTFYPVELVEANRQQDRLHVWFHMDQKKRFYPDALEWHAQFQQDGARLRVALEASDGPRLTVRVHGEAIDPEHVYMGRDLAHGALDGQSLDLSALAADPAAFDEALLPRRFAVYVWFVPPAAQRNSQELDPDMRDAMRALGYLE